MSQKAPKQLSISTFYPVRQWCAGFWFVGVLTLTTAVQGLAEEKSSPLPNQPALAQQAMLDSFFKHLAQAQSPAEAQVIVGSIERVWRHSGSDTADLLMSRAVSAVNSKDNSLALQMLDVVVNLEPDWAEAWNQRATVRYLEEDDEGSMRDISRVLVLEPRHFGALAGMGYILQRNGNDKRALEVFRHLLEINPQQEGIRRIVDKMAPEVDGREL